MRFSFPNSNSATGGTRRCLRLLVRVYYSFWWTSSDSSAGFLQVERVEPAGAALRGRQRFSLTTPPRPGVSLISSREQVCICRLIGTPLHNTLSSFLRIFFREIDPRIDAVPKRVQRAHACINVDFPIHRSAFVWGKSSVPHQRPHYQ